MSTHVPVPAAEVSRGHRVTFQVLSVLVALAAAAGLFGLPALLTSWGMTGEDLIHRVHGVQWGALMGLAIPVAALSQVRRAELHIASMQFLAAMAVLFAIAGAVVARAEDVSFVILVVVALAALVVADPSRSRLFEHRPASLNLAASSAVLGVPLAVYAVMNAVDERAITSSNSHAGHYIGASILAMAVVALAIITTYRATGWRLTGWLAGLTLAVLGLGSVLNPDLASSLGRGWGSLAVLGGIAFVALTEVEHARDALDA